MKRFYITLAGLFLMALAWELSAQRTTFYNTKVGINTNSPVAILHIQNPDIGTTGIQINHIAGSGSDVLRVYNGAGALNLSIGVAGDFWSGGGAFIRTLTITNEVFFLNGPVAIGTNGAITSLEIFSADQEGAFKIATPHGSALMVLTNGNVGLGTNDPKALLHLYSPLTANPKLLQFDDDGHVPRAFAGIFPGGGGFSFFNGAGTNDNARTIGWTATSTIMNAPTTVEFQVGGVAQHRLTLTQFAPVSDNAERLGTSALRYSEGNFVNLTNAGSMSVGGRFGQTNKTLAYAGTTNVFVDGTLGNVFNLTLTANTHLIFTNIQEAYSGWINLVQDGTGSRLLSYNNANVKTNATITASTAAGSVDVLFFATGLIGTNLNIILHTAFK